MIREQLQQDCHSSVDKFSLSRLRQDLNCPEWPFSHSGMTWTVQSNNSASADSAAQPELSRVTIQPQQTLQHNLNCPEWPFSHSRLCSMTWTVQSDHSATADSAAWPELSRVTIQPQQTLQHDLNCSERSLSSLSTVHSDNSIAFPDWRMPTAPERK